MPQTHILVADDSRTVRTLLRRILSHAGYNVSVACDGQEAVEAVVEQRPDLVVLDIHMPGMDGYEACQNVMSLGPPWSEIPILLLTHAEGPHLNVLGSELGAYLRKPIEPEVVLRTVRALLDRSGGRRSPHDVVLA